MRIEYRYEDVSYNHERLLTDVLNEYAKKGRRLVSMSSGDRGISNLIFERRVKIFTRKENMIRNVDFYSKEFQEWYNTISNVEKANLTHRTIRKCFVESILAKEKLETNKLVEKFDKVGVEVEMTKCHICGHELSMEFPNKKSSRHICINKKCEIGKQNKVIK